MSGLLDLEATRASLAKSLFSLARHLQSALDAIGEESWPEETWARKDADIVSTAMHEVLAELLGWPIPNGTGVERRRPDVLGLVQAALDITDPIQPDRGTLDRLQLCVASVGVHLGLSWPQARAAADRFSVRNLPALRIEDHVGQYHVQRLPYGWVDPIETERWLHALATLTADPSDDRAWLVAAGFERLLGRFPDLESSLDDTRWSIAPEQVARVALAKVRGLVEVGFRKDVIH